MQDRRNFYRVLHLQPDAPFELVRANYRALMVKLAAHPDLGGEHWSAAHLNEAYGTLRDPDKRAEYDALLLARYDLETLSLGRKSLMRPKRSIFKQRDPSVNRRNYYRILGVQVDAPRLIVETSYEALRKKADVEHDRAGHDLIEEAFAVLGDPALRKAYDEWIETDGHIEAVARVARMVEAGDEPEPEVPSGSALARESAPAYETPISHYCAFCKTPFAAEHPKLPHARDCVECSSPLFPPPESLRALGRRVVSRQQRDDPIELSVHWPGAPAPGRLVDLSPTGMRCTTPWPLDVGERAKVDSARFLAVGEVSHRTRTADGTLAGLRFLTVRFQEQRGAFVSVEA